MRVMATMTAAVLLAVHAIGAHAPETTGVQAPQGGAGRGGAQAPPVDSRTVWAGELLIEPPTLINLGFEWFVEDDDNRNAAVAVSYRKTGDTAWKESLPLLRLNGERVYSQYRLDVLSPNMFAGSILDLSIKWQSRAGREPNQCRALRRQLRDPETRRIPGVIGQGD